MMSKLSRIDVLILSSKKNIKYEKIKRKAMFCFVERRSMILANKSGGSSVNAIVAIKNRMTPHDNSQCDRNTFLHVLRIIVCTS